jgi:TorA maturation chaperone TorD
MELIRALAVFAEPPDENLSSVAAALGFETLPSTDEYTDIFLFQLVPYASVYLGEEGLLGGEARDRIAGFWRVLNLTPPVEPDHIATMLSLYVNLCQEEEMANGKEQMATFHHARKVFLHEHILSWLPVYLRKLKQIATPFYFRWAEILEEVLIEESKLVGEQETLSIHLSEPLNLIDPREEGFENFLSSLLAPVRSGMILTRDDFKRTANDLNLGLRMGERKFMLESLFGQDAQRVLNWLSNEAQEWLQWHQSQEEIYGATAEAWAVKANATLKTLKELADV